LSSKAVGWTTWDGVTRPPPPFLERLKTSVLEGPKIAAGCPWLHTRAFLKAEALREKLLPLPPCPLFLVSSRLPLPGCTPPHPSPGGRGGGFGPAAGWEPTRQQHFRPPETEPTPLGLEGPCFSGWGRQPTIPRNPTSPPFPPAPSLGAWGAKGLEGCNKDSARMGREWESHPRDPCGLGEPGAGAGFRHARMKYYTSEWHP